MRSACMNSRRAVHIVRQYLMTLSFIFHRMC
jgi:hypothetical protein